MNFHLKKSKGKNVFFFCSRILTKLYPIFQKKEFYVSLKTRLQEDAYILSRHLYHYCQSIYQSVEFGYFQLTLAEIKLLTQQELQKYRQQIGLASSIRFEAAEPKLCLSELLSRFASFKQQSDASKDSLYRISFIYQRLLDVCSDVELGSINHTTTRKFYQYLDNLKLKDRSKLTPASVVIAAFNWAVSQGYVKVNYFTDKMKLVLNGSLSYSRQPFTKGEMQLILSPKLMG